MRRKKTNIQLLRRSAVSFVFLLCAVIAQGNVGIETSLHLDRNFINYENNQVNYKFVISNQSLEPTNLVSIEVLVKLKTQETFSKKLDVQFSGDLNENEILDPEEEWVFSGSESFDNSPGEIYEIIGTCVLGENLEYVFVQVDRVFCVGINMETDFYLDNNIGSGDTINITLTTRLLIDEDGAINPGFSTFNVGDKKMKVALPASRWEARDLMISATMLNDGKPFDPFDPPPGIELTNFCDQDGKDQGRNTLNILDERDPIETVRAPCKEFGENDVRCEFPDWVFCYDIILPIGFEEKSLEISATDQFSMWQSKETNPGSGDFGPFRDVTNHVDTGGEDSAIKMIDQLSWDNLVIDIDQQSDMLFISTSTPADQVQIVIYDRSGLLVFDNVLPLSRMDHLIDLDSGDYVIFVFDSNKVELGNTKLSIKK